MGKMFVGNLPWSATEQQVREAFAVYGEVSSVKLIMDRETNKPRGFGFVEMANSDAAIAGLNGKDLGGRNLVVNIAKEREPRVGGGGGYSQNRGGYAPRQDNRDRGNYRRDER